MTNLRCVIADPSPTRAGVLVELLTQKAAIRRVESTDSIDGLKGLYEDTDVDVFVLDWDLVADRSLTETAELIRAAGPNRCLLLLPFDILHQKPDIGLLGAPYVGRPAMPEAIHSIVLQLTANLTALRVIQNLEAERHLTQKLEALGRLAASVAHDFNNQLSVITAFTTATLTEMGPTHPLRSNLEKVTRAASNAGDLVRRLLAFGRKQVLRPRRIDLNGAVRGAADMLGRLLHGHITLEMKLSDGVGCVEVDPAQIDQVITNLIVNARDAMEGGGSLTIETADAPEARLSSGGIGAETDRDHVRLTVRDTGHGMDASTVAHIFEPFFTTKSQSGGVGLGLATVYGIVRQSGGTIRVESEPGSGTAFHVYLPRAATADAPLVTSSISVSGPPEQRQTVLIVEDERVVRVTAASVLKRHGYEVLEAESGEAALELLATDPRPVGLMITELELPTTSGPALAERARIGRPGLRVLFVSGSGSIEFLATANGSRSRVIQRPFTPSALVEQVRASLAERR